MTSSQIKTHRSIDFASRTQHDAHVWGVHSFYQFWNDAPWPVFDHVQAWGEWSDLNTAVQGEWL